MNSIETKNMLTLRPHHLIDIIRDIGNNRQLIPHPYGHAQHLITQIVLDGSDTSVKLVAAADDICSPCIHLTKDGSCDDILSQLDYLVMKQAYNDDLDHRLFEFLELQEGTLISIPEYLSLIKSRFDDIVPLCVHPKEDISERREGMRRGLAKLMR